ncbi:MAG: Ig-like domain-containing protein [Planctomycetota bacterium]|nr:Ig-like domain-containing protein [Planctomycetota bacterium]
MTARLTPASMRWLSVTALGVSVLLSACNDTTSKSSTSFPSGTYQVAPGQTDPNSSRNQLRYVVADHSAGLAGSLKLTSVTWGRLVDVYAPLTTGGTPVRLFKDYLIPGDVLTDGQFYTLGRQLGTGVETLTIDAPYNADVNGQPQSDPNADDFLELFDPLAQSLQLLINKSVDPSELPPFTAVPRNAAVAITFNDLIDPTTISENTIKLAVGYPPESTQIVRVIPDPNYGDVINGTFYSARILVDFTVSPFEAQANNSPVNSVGLPSAQNTAQANVAVRIPTRLASGAQFELLKSLGGSTVAFTGNGATDPLAPSLDVVRAFRSGGPTTVTQDPFNGFLPDTTAPTGTIGVSGAEYRTPWLRALDQVTRPECWVAVQPPPASSVGTGISTTATFSLRFSEPMDPTRLNAFDSFQLLYGIVTPALQGQVVGQVAASGDLTRYTFQPSQRLRHVNGSTETFRVNLPTGASGPVDLAGNPVDFALTDSNSNLPDFTLRSIDATIESRGVMLKFNALDEDPNSSPAGSEVRGQLIYDLLNGRVLPRSVTRISAVCDLNTPIIAVDQTVAGTTAATRLPFTPFGCRLMTLWRHADLGFLLQDDLTHNLDVEGLNWSPVNSGLQIDTLPLFQMSIAHSRRLPDELVAMGAPVHPNSSISDTFDANMLDPVGDPLKVVHQKTEGYFIQPSAIFQAATGTAMAPWPMNEGKAAEDFIYYTWRDTALLGLGQPNVGAGSGQGVRLGNETAYDPTTPASPYGLGLVPTIGLPLLMDFRVYPNSQIQGSNQLLGFFAIASNPPGTEVPPFWTAYTAGGIPAASGVPITVDPDSATIAQGNLATPGAAGALPRNQVIFFGQGDFVVRVNRAHTRWFECAPGAAGLPFNFAEPVIEPSVSSLPAGTQLLVQYRGATGMNSAGNKPWEVATELDAYGNARPGGTAFTVTFLGGDRTWKDSMADINGSQFFQARITMVSNPISGATPELRSLGFAFAR